MMMRYHEITEARYQLPNEDIALPDYYFRGSPEGMSSSYITRVWRQPGNDTPPFASEILQSGKTERVYGLSYNMPFRISRTYQGMSNWGYGVYFASTIEWALRYGTSITVVSIDPAEVLAIRAHDFADQVAGTVGAELRARLNKATGDSMRMRDEAAVMSRVVKTMKSKAKALYVEISPGEGQICVFGKSAIYPKFYFELKSETK